MSKLILRVRLIFKLGSCHRSVRGAFVVSWEGLEIAGLDLLDQFRDGTETLEVGTC